MRALKFFSLGFRTVLLCAPSLHSVYGLGWQRSTVRIRRWARMQGGSRRA